MPGQSGRKPLQIAEIDIPNLTIYQEPYRDWEWKYYDERFDTWRYSYEWAGGVDGFKEELAALCHFTRVVISLYEQDDSLML